MAATVGTGCGGASSTPILDGIDGSATEPVAEAGPGLDGSVLDAALVDSAGPPAFADDGTPSRVACTATLGHGLSPVHGRLDGVLVSIVGTNAGGCPSDPDHLHLQVKMGAGVYDIAVNLDGLEGEFDAPLPGVPFAEGWHPMSLDYVKDLGVHASALSLTGKAAIRARVISQLTNANHISVFATGYPGSDGAHLVHRNPTNRDGALVIDPLAAKAHVIAFRFSNDSF